MAMIVLPSQKERNLIFNKRVNLDSIGELSKSILDINQDDEYIGGVYDLHGLSYTPKPIRIYIDSYGGAVYQCLGILGIIKNSKTPVYTIVTGCSMSAAFLMSVSGHKRYAYDGATFMYHQISSIDCGKLKEIEEELIESKRLQEIIEEHVLKTTNISKEKLKEIYEKKRDWFMDTKKALKYGVIDEII